MEHTPSPVASARQGAAPTNSRRRAVIQPQRLAAILNRYSPPRPANDDLVNDLLRRDIEAIETLTIIAGVAVLILGLIAWAAL